MTEFFRPLIARWDEVTAFANEVGCARTLASEWKRQDSIPAAWFSSVVRAALKRGFTDISADFLAHLAEQRRLAKEAERRQTADTERPAA